MGQNRYEWWSHRDRFLVRVSMHQPLRRAVAHGAAPSREIGVHLSDETDWEPLISDDRTLADFILADDEWAWLGRLGGS